jgi:predicted DNA-binding transcriptional regulator YafY
MIFSELPSKTKIQGGINMSIIDYTKGQNMIRMLLEIMRDPKRTHTQIATKLEIKKWDYTRYFTELCSVAPLRYESDPDNPKKKRYYLDLAFKSKYLKSPDEFYQFIVSSQIISQGRLGNTDQIFTLVNNNQLLSESLKSLARQMTFLSLPESFVNIVDKLHLINEAIFIGRKIKFEYRKGEKILNDTVVSPYKLIFDRWWYLTGRAEYNGEQRNYRLSRMSSLEILKDQNFMMPTEDRIEIKRISVPWDFGNGTPMTVEMELDRKIALRLREDPVHSTQFITDLDNGKSLFTLSVRSPINMTNWIFSLGTSVKVLGPECLKDAIREQLQVMQSVIV